MWPRTPTGGGAGDYCQYIGVGIARILVQSPQYSDEHNLKIRNLNKKFQKRPERKKNWYLSQSPKMSLLCSTLCHSLLCWPLTYKRKQSKHKMMPHDYKFCCNEISVYENMKYFLQQHNRTVAAEWKVIRMWPLIAMDRRKGTKKEMKACMGHCFKSIMRFRWKSSSYNLSYLSSARQGTGFADMKQGRDEQRVCMPGVQPLGPSNDFHLHDWNPFIEHIGSIQGDKATKVKPSREGETQEAASTWLVALRAARGWWGGEQAGAADFDSR